MLHIIHIIVQLAAFFDNTVLHLDLVILDGVVACREQTVSHVLGDVILTIIRSIVLHTEIIDIFANLYRTGFLLHIIHIIVQLTAFFNNTGLHLDLVIFDGVVACREQAIRHVLGNVVLAIIQCVILHAEVINIIINLHSTGFNLLVIDIVIQLAAFFNNTVLHLDLVVLNVVVTGREQTIGHILSNIVLAIIQCVILHAEVVNIVVNLYCTLLDARTVLVVIQLAAFFHEAILHDHLTISAEGVSTGRYQAVSLRRSNRVRTILGAGTSAIKATANAAQIIRTIHIVQTSLGDAILNDVVITINFIHTVSRMYTLIRCAIGTEIIPDRRHIRIILYEADAGIHIVITAKVVCLAVNLNPCTRIAGRAIAVDSTLLSSNPCTTLQDAILVKGVGTSSDDLGHASIYLIGAGACIAITICCRLPAGFEGAVDGVVQAAVHFEDAGAGGIDLAAAFIGADELAVNDLIVMGDDDLGDDGAPIDHRLTGFAVSSVFIARFSSGSFLVQDGQLLVVDMIGRRNGGQLGSDIDAAAEGVAINNTVNHFAFDVDSRLVAHFCYSIILTCNSTVAVIGPNTDRDTHQSVISFLANGSFTLHCNGQQFGNLVIIQSDFETIGHDSALGFPLVGIVQLQNGNQLIDAGKIRNIDVHIVDGLCLGGLAGIIVAAQFNHGIARNSEGTGDLSGVAQFVLNLKYNGMCTCTESNVTLGGKCIAIDGGFYHNTINGDLAGGKVERSIISNGCRECNIIAIDNGAVLQRNSGIGGRVSGVRNSGQLSVIYSRAVVQSNVVDVESNYISGVRLYISTDEGRRTGVCLVRRRHSRQIVVLADIDSCINPTGLGNICIGRRVQVRLLAGSSRGEHKMVLHTRCFSVNRPVCIGIELRLERKALACCRECIFGNIDPHAKGSSLLSACNVTENDYVISVKENVVSPPCKISIGIVKSPCESIVTVSNLTSIGKGRNKCVATNVIAKLTCKRIRANQRVVDAVFLAPLLGFLKAHESSLIAIFEVPNNFGALTEFDSVSQNGFTISNGNINACDRFIIGRSKLEAIQDAGSSIGNRNLNYIGIHVDIRLAGHSHDGQRNRTNLFRRRIRNHSGGCGKLEYLRVSNSNGLGANYLATGNHLDVHSASLAVGNELAVYNGAKGCIGQSPGCISGHIHRITMGIDCLGTESVGSAGGKNIVVGLNIHHIQHTGGGDIGSDEDAVSGGTLCAVAGNGTHGEVLFANTLGNEGGGTAAVTVGSPLTAQGQHGFTKLIAIKTNRVVGTTTVVHTDHEGTVFLNTYHRTSSSRISCTTSFSLVNKLSVLNGHAEGNANGVQQDAVFQIPIELRTVECLNITGNVAFGILEYVQNGLGRGSLSLNTDALAVVDQHTGGVGIIIKVGVHTADNVVSEVILVILGHFGQLLMRPVCLILRILGQLIDLIVSRDDGYIGVRRVNFNNVKNLSAGAVSIVQHDFGLNSCTGHEDVIFFGDHVVIAIGAEGFAVINDIVIRPVGDGCQRSCGQHADQRHQGDDQCYYAISGFCHNFFFLSCFYIICQAHIVTFKMLLT